MNYLKILVIAIRIGLGCLFLYAGVKKFIPKDRPAKAKQETVTTSNGESDKATAKVQQLEEKSPESRIGPFIGGLKQTGYFWTMLGVAELLCGLLLISQVGSLLGAVMLVPITLNIFLFHLFLEPHEVGELITTALYFVGNLFLIGYEYPKLKPVFLK